MFRRMVWSLVFLLSSMQVFPQVTIKDGKKYIDYVAVRFSADVFKTKDTVVFSATNDMKPQHSRLRNCLEFFHAHLLEKAVPQSRSSDSIGINDQGESVRFIDMSRYYIIRFITPVLESQVLDSLRGIPGVEAASGPVGIGFRIDPNDVEACQGRQYALSRVRVSGRIGAWEITTGGRTTTSGAENSVAIMEGGGMEDHPELTGKIRGGEPLVPGSNHGTAVASITSALTNNGNCTSTGGVASIGYKTMVTPYDITNPTNFAADMDAARNLAYVKVINMSFGFECLEIIGTTTYCRPCTENELQGFGHKNAVINAYNAGKVLVAAGGNAVGCTGSVGGGFPPHPNWQIPYVDFPMGWEQVIAVSATNILDQFRSGWNYGPKIELSAPGVSIRVPNGSVYVNADGTSLSSPMVAAVAALVKDINPILTAADVRQKLRDTAEPLGDPGPDPYYGYGRVDAYRAVREAIPNQLTSTRTTFPPTLLLLPNPFVNTAVFLKNSDRIASPPPLSHAILGTNLTLNNSTLVVERNTWLRTDFYLISYLNGGRFVLEPGAEIISDLYGVIALNNSSGVTFQGEGSCIGLRRGTLRLEDGAELRVNNQGILASFDPSTIELGTNAKIIIEADGYLKWFANSNMIMGSGAVIEIYGTVEVADGVTLSLPSTSNFNLHPGAQVKMGTNALISTEGKFHAIGTAQSPIIFQGNNGATWNGIRAKSGNFSGILGDIRVERATFSNATKPIHLETPVAAYIANVTMNSPQIGVEILPNYNLWVEPPQPPTMQLNAVTINGAFTYGVTVENFSDLQLGSCVVSGNQGIAGIALTGSSPKILESTFQGFDIGIWGVANSAPLLFDQGIGGYNVFTSNITAAQFEGNSNAALGIDDGVGGRNAFTQYQQYAIVLADNSVVHSEWNWYATPSPTQNLFSITGGSKLYWEPYLTSPPRGNGATSSIAGKEEVEDPRFTPTDPRMKQVLQLRVQGRNTEASALLIAIIADGGATMQIKRWALGHLLAVSQKLRDPNLAAYLNTLQLTVPQLRQYLAELMPSAHIHERAVRNALDCYTSNIRNHGNSITEAQALYGKFSHALYGEGNRTEAQALLNTLQSRYSRSGQTKLATAQFNATRQSMSPGNGPVAKGGANVSSNSAQIGEATPSVFALHQNYPNPFNPTTNLRFQIADFGLVTLKVFDVLGREVATLVNGELNAGAHEAVFDASNLASGIYMYKLQAGAQTEVKRMILMK